MAWKHLGNQHFRLKCDKTGETVEGHEDDLIDKGWKWGQDTVKGDTQRWAASPEVDRGFIFDKIKNHEKTVE